MATTNFVDEETVIEADWLNDVDEVVYTTVPSHTSSIATNTANIATNTANIATNTSDITNKAAKGANSDITSLTGLTTPLATTYGGTGFAGPCGFHATAAGDQSGVVTATWTDIVFDTETYDLGSPGNFSGSTFTAPAQGYYLFTVTVASSTSLSDGGLFGVRFLGSVQGNLATNYVQHGAANTRFITTSWVGRLNNAETVKAQVLHNHGSNITLDATNNNGTMHFSGHRLG